MIFQKRAKKFIESNFHIDNEPVEAVQNYTFFYSFIVFYLGTLISSAGNFSLALDKLKEKALHALFSLRKHTNFSKLPPDLANKIFDAMISSILTHNRKSRVHMQNYLISNPWTVPRSRKRHLEVSNKASNVACRAELGRFPLIIAINQKIMNYSSYILSKDNCPIVKQIFLMSQDLQHAGKNSYYSNIIDMPEYYNFPCFDLTNLTNAKIKLNVSLMQQKYNFYGGKIQYKTLLNWNFSTLLRTIIHPPPI